MGINLKMEKNWVKVYTSPDQYKTAIVASVLEDQLVKVVTLNRKDSSYQNFGEIELYVAEEDFNRAIEIIIKSDLSE